MNMHGNRANSLMLRNRQEVVKAVFLERKWLEQLRLPRQPSGNLLRPSKRSMNFERSDAYCLIRCRLLIQTLVLVVYPGNAICVPSGDGIAQISDGALLNTWTWPSR